jgi:hypothetical protein
MVYKVKVVTKNNMSEIRYITDSEVISDNVNVMAEIDAIRDIANNIMTKQPDIKYNDATKLAKEIRYGVVNKTNTEEPVKEKNNELPGIEVQEEQEDVLFGLEPSKQMVLTKQ